MRELVKSKKSSTPAAVAQGAAATAAAATATTASPSSAGSVASPTLSGDASKNPVMALNEISMSRQLKMDWQLSEHGVPPRRTFAWTVTLGDYQATGTAFNKKVGESFESWRGNSGYFANKQQQQQNCKIT